MSTSDAPAPVGPAEQAADWCLRFADDRLSTEELASFDRWIADPANRQAFDEAILAWRAVDLVADRPELLAARSEALDDLRRVNRRRWAGDSRRSWLPRVAAMVIAMLVVFASASLLMPRSSSYRTDIGERRLATLSDGSKVSLDAATDLDVAMASDSREITLNAGRARFDVAKDPARPFRVRAGNRLVVATGTSFSVELVGGEVRVQLYEGHVETYALAHASAAPIPLRLDGGGRRAAQALAPGRELIASAAVPVASVRTIDSARALGWEAGQLNFDDEPLPSAIERMNRYSRRKLVVADERTAALRIDGVFQAGDTAAFIEGLSVLYDVHVHEAGGTVTLHSEK